MSSQPCIQPNPDISGVGVRAAFYAQCIIYLVPPVLFASDADLSNKERTSLRQYHTILRLSGIALTISALIQTFTFGLSIQHSIVILNLSWMVNISATAILSLFFARAYRSSASKDLYAARHQFRRKHGRQLMVPFVLAMLHMCSIGILGFFTWLRPWEMGSHVRGWDPCTMNTVTTIFFRDIPITSRGLQGFYLLLYITLMGAFLFLPLQIFATLICSQIFTVAIYLVARGIQAVKSSERARATLDRWFDTMAPMFWCTIVLNAGIGALFIVDTELLIQHNEHLLTVGDSKESDWTFGQTLSLILVVFPVLDVVQGGREWLRRSFPHLDATRITEIDRKSLRVTTIMDLEESLERLNRYIYGRARPHSCNAILLSSAAALLACEAALFASEAGTRAPGTESLARVLGTITRISVELPAFTPLERSELAADFTKQDMEQIDRLVSVHRRAIDLLSKRDFEFGEDDWPARLERPISRLASEASRTSLAQPDDNMISEERRSTSIINITFAD